MTFSSLPNSIRGKPEEVMPISREISQKLANLSFVLACLVVSLHIPEVSPNAPVIWIQRFFRLGVSRIAVPFFFGISGFLIAGKINPDNYRREIVKRVRSLLIPFWLSGGVFLCLRYALFFVYERKAGATLPPELSPSLSLLITWSGVNPTGALSTLWFLRTLFLLVCISPFLIRGICILKYKWVVCSWLLFVCWKMVGSLIYPGINAFFEYGLSLSGVWAFSFGICIRMYGFQPPRVFFYVCTALACMLWSITWVVVGYFKLNVRGGYLLPFFIPCCAYSVWELMPSSPLPKLLTSSSFPIYLMHYLFIVFVEKSCLLQRPSTIGGYLLYWSVPVISYITVAYGLRSICPKVASVLFGGRK